ncbi:MAG: hypothetical protein V3U93_07605 [Alphaproteobacteria bacterium]
MTGYSVRGLNAGAVVLAFLGLAPFAPALAQPLAPAGEAAGAPPTSLAPSPTIGPKATERPSLSPAPVFEAPESISSAPSVVEVGKGALSIKVDQLKAVDPDSVGLLDEEDDGFGIDMWKGTSRSLVERLLPTLPAALSSPVMRGLQRRLLLSTATAPRGPKSRRSLVAVRVEKLASMGDVKAVGELLRVAPSKLSNESLARAQVDNSLLTNDNAGACTLIRRLIRQYHGPFWQKGLAFCQALASEHAMAALGADLLREQGHERDQAFFTLIRALGGDKQAVVESLSDPAPLHLAMMRAARQPLPADVLLAQDAAILRTIALSPNASLEGRLEAAERAEALGALASESLAELYAGATFTPEQISEALSLAEADRGPRGRALLYHAARIQSVPTARAEVLKKAWALARQSGGYETSVRIHLAALLEIEPAQELAWFAGEAGRALLAAGRFEAAAAWLSLSRQAPRGGDGEGGGKAADLSLWPLVQLADAAESLPWDGAALKRWWQAQKEGDEDELRARAVMLYTLLEVLDEPVGASEWEPLLEGPQYESVKLPAPALLHGLRLAASNGRVGETVLLALLCLGGDGPAGANPLVLSAVISGLRQIGLDTEARALALEAAIGAGI